LCGLVIRDPRGYDGLRLLVAAEGCCQDEEDCKGLFHEGKGFSLFLKYRQKPVFTAFGVIDDVKINIANNNDGFSFSLFLLTFF